MVTVSILFENARLKYVVIFCRQCEQLASRNQKEMDVFSVDWMCNNHMFEGSI